MLLIDLNLLLQFVIYIFGKEGYNKTCSLKGEVYMCDYEYLSVERFGKKCLHPDYGGTTIDGKHHIFCIFHHPAKSADEFWEEFFKLIERFKAKDAGDWDFEGFYFPATHNQFRIYEFPENVSINFRDTTFLGRADFYNACFLGDVCFDNSKFKDIVYFPIVSFKKRASFRNVDFKEAHFEQSVFEDIAVFEDSKFNWFSAFQGAVFKGSSYFNGGFCKERSDFTGVVFSEYALFVKREFEEVDFSEAKFKSEVSFENAIIKASIWFNDSHFEKEAIMTGINVAKFILTNTIFDAPIDFRKCTFTGDFKATKTNFNIVNFDDTKFLNVVDFSGVIFNKEVGFVNVFFRCKVNFGWVVFKDSVTFLNAIIIDEISFYSTSFNSICNFHGARLAKCFFTGSSFKIKPFFGGLCAGSQDISINDLIVNAVIEFTRGYKRVEIDNITGEIKYIDKKDKSFSISVLGGEIDGLFTIRAPVENIEMVGTAFPATVSIAPQNTNPVFKANNVSFLGDTSINDVNIQEMTNCAIANNMRIIESDLSKAHFYRVDLSKIDFENVEWVKIARPRSSILLRIFNRIFSNKLIRYRRTDGLHDEIAKGCGNKIGDCFLAPSLKKTEKQEIEQLEEMYRQVASSYESRRRYGMAGHFKAGEFEIRRFRKERKDCKADKNRKDTLLNRFILLVYRWTSFYGEEVFKPFMLLVFLVPILSTLLITPLLNRWVFDFSLFQSFIISILSQFYNFSFFQNISLSGLSDFFYDFFNSIPYGIKGLYSINFEIENDPNLQDCLCNWQRVFVYIILFFEKMLVALFTSQFIFALRRRVKR